MGYVTHSQNSPGGSERDDADQARLRHGRDRHQGFALGQYLQPAPLLFTRDGHNVFLGDILRGRAMFLCCGGPSLARHDLSLLQQRGIVTCAVNNAATVVRPNYWVSVDDPGNFADVIWRDPAITKLVPLCHMEKPFTVRDPQGKLVSSPELVGDMPGVLGFRRNEAFVAEQFLSEDTVNWGNHGRKTDAYGFRGCRSVMLAAVRLMYYLGARTIYLLGCDFRMEHGAQNYAFPQDRSRASVRNNNHTYEALNVRFQHLRPHLERAGLQVFNCTPNSGLTAFETCAYETAVQRAIEEVPRTIATVSMYDRKASTMEAAPPQVRVTPESVRTAEADLPPLTLFTTLDEQTRTILPHTWRSWLKFHPVLRKLPALVLHPRELAIEDCRRALTADHPSVKFVAWPKNHARTGRDQWWEAWLKFPSQQIKTPWYIKLEPEALATADVPWLLPEWFRPDEQGRLPAWIASPWGYSKPAQVLQTLDDWGDQVPALSAAPRLNVPVVAGEGRVQHEAISSWLLIGSTAWTMQLAEAVARGWPAASYDTLLAYWAARRRDRTIRYFFKSHGWDHSYRGRERLVARCQALLGAADTAPDAGKHGLVPVKG